MLVDSKRSTPMRFLVTSGIDQRERIVIGVVRPFEETDRKHDPQFNSKCAHPPQDGVIPGYKVGSTWFILRDELRQTLEAGANARREGTPPIAHESETTEGE